MLTPKQRQAQKTKAWRAERRKALKAQAGDKDEVGRRVYLPSPRAGLEELAESSRMGESRGTVDGEPLDPFQTSEDAEEPMLVLDEDSDVRWHQSRLHSLPFVSSPGPSDKPVSDLVTPGAGDLMLPQFVTSEEMQDDEEFLSHTIVRPDESPDSSEENGKWETCVPYPFPNDSFFSSLPFERFLKTN